MSVFKPLLCHVFIHQAPVAQKVDKVIHWIHPYPVDNAIGFPNIYLLNSAMQLLKNRGQHY